MLHDVWYVVRPEGKHRPMNPSFPRDYTFVATVEAKDLDGVWRKTNSVDSPWWENDGVTHNYESEEWKTYDGVTGARSSMVNDVFVQHPTEDPFTYHPGGAYLSPEDRAADGHPFVVDTVGFVAVKVDEPVGERF